MFRIITNKTGCICRSFSSKLPSVTVTKRKYILTKVFAISTGAFLTYDGVANNFVYLKATQRFLRSMNIAAQITTDYLWNLRHISETSEIYETTLKEIHFRCAKRILQGCLINGGLYIKVGQGVAAINHILPEEYTKTLSQLQNECLPSDEDDVRTVFIKDFGKSPEEIFKEFNYQPIAAASLAQVFKATLNNGEVVAVKVQYNDLQKRFTSDLGTIKFLQDVVGLFFKNYNFGWILKDLRKNLEQELDFINEGQNAERCAKDLAKFKYIHIPKVYWNFTKTRVLTAEWIDGYKITDLENIKKEKINISDVDKKLFNAFSEQIFNTGFVHADPHPGNILLRKNKSGYTEVILLDHGLYEYLPESVRTPLCKFWEACVLKDEAKMKINAKLLNVKDYKQLAEVLFQTPFEIENKIKAKLTEEDIKYMQYIAKHHFNLIMGTLKDMPRNMLFVVRNLNTIRAIGREHGDPVDRPKLMARYAQKCIYKKENIFSNFLKWFFRRLHFEYYLLKSSLQLRLIALYFDVLFAFGRSTCDSTILKTGLV